VYRTIDAAEFHAQALSRNLSSRSRHEHSLLVIAAGSGWERALWYRHAKMASYERGDERKRDPTSTIAPSHLNIHEGQFTRAAVDIGLAFSVKLSSKY
jgi:hypothetical protein